ncbi:MAG: hypothetical protein AB7L65_10335 [Hyphomonadaceae bacterium]
MSGCAIAPHPDVDAFARATDANSFDARGAFVSQEALVLPVVQDRQTEGPSCGAHALASVVNYWRGPGVLSGLALYRASPPASPAGYSLAELQTLAGRYGLLASAVRLPEAGLIEELERGRPVLTPVRLPSIYVQQRTFPGGDLPVLGWVRRTFIGHAGRLQERTNAAMIDHYLLVVGYQGDVFVVVEPVMGYRTIRFSTLQRYRAPFENAALVLSAPAPPRALEAVGTAS